MSMQQLIVEEARKWKGTPYKHQGKTLGRACDCVGILIGIGHNLFGVEDNFDSRYGHNPENWTLKKELDDASVLIRKNDTNNIEVGDIALMSLEQSRIPHHIGIISDYSDKSFGLIHCYSSIGRVVEHRMNDVWKNRILHLYKYKG